MKLPEYLYHVTYYSRLYPSDFGDDEGGIVADGLVPGAASAIGKGAGYVQHSEGKVFFTEGGGVHFWFSKAEEWADYSTEDTLGEGLAPVVLRFSGDWALDYNLEEDPIGTRDAMHTAFSTKDPIPPEELEVWTGRAWEALDEATMRPIELAFDIDRESAEADARAEMEEGDEDYPEHLLDDNGELKPYVTFKDVSPFFPPELW